MDEMDHILQAKLAELESGIPLDKVLAGLPPEAQDLAPLIALANAARNAPHPQLSGEVARAQQARVAAAARVTQPVAKRAPVLAIFQNRLVLGGAVALFIVVALVGLGISLMTANPVSTQTARLADIAGLVEVAPAAQSSEWHFLTGSEQVRQGQRIRTYADSSATLIFFDGSRTLIGPDSDLTLTTLNGQAGDVLQVQLTQHGGSTQNEVIPLRGQASFFQVDTPSGRANVHGTRFDVAVAADGGALFAVTSGVVQVSNATSAVTLVSGQAAAVLPGQELDEIGYRFRLEGAISAMAGSLWTVAGVQFTVLPQTELQGTFQVGEYITVQGRVLASGEWVADRIQPARKDREKSSFSGVIESMPGVPGTWVISGRAVLVDRDTELDAGLKVGSAVEVSFIVLPNNGGWLAREIESLEDEAGKRTPTPTGTLPTSTKTATPTTTVTGTPGTVTPTGTATPTVVPKNESSRCENRAEEHPDAIRLAARYGVTSLEIMEWFCKGFGFGEIDLAYGLSQSSGVVVSQIFSMRSGGMGWGNIKKELSNQITPMATPTPRGKAPKLEKTVGPKK